MNDIVVKIIKNDSKYLRLSIQLKTVYETWDFTFLFIGSIYCLNSPGMLKQNNIVFLSARNEGQIIKQNKCSLIAILNLLQNDNSVCVDAVKVP